MVAAVLTGLWAVAVVAGAEAIGWLVTQLLLTLGLDQPAWVRFVPSLAAGLLVALPATPLALLPRGPAVRAAGRAWLLGAAALAGLGLVRAVPTPQNEFYLAALAVVAVALGSVLRTGRRRTGGPSEIARTDRPGGSDRRRTWRPGSAARSGRATAPPADVAVSGPHRERSSYNVFDVGSNSAPPGRQDPATAGPPDREAPAATGLAATAGLAVLLPWVCVGALGGLLETVLAVTAAVAVGRLAASILDVRFWATYRRWPDGRPHPVRLLLLGGPVAGVALLLVAAGTGQDGAQLAALLTLPPLGFATATLAGSGAYPPGGRPWRPVGWLVGLAAVGPLAFADPEEISLLLLGRDVPFWVAVAAGGSLTIALLVAAGYAVAFARLRPRRPGRRPVAAALGLLLVAVAGLYVGAGQPGLYGEKLFVVLREQADLTGVPVGLTGFAGRATRGEAVYRRLVDTAERSQAGLRRDLRRLHLRHTPYYLVNAVEVEGGPAVREWLSRRSDVDRVLLSQRLRPLPAAPRPDRGALAQPAAPPWNITMIGADRVRSGLGVTGAGIVVGTSDSGVDGAHPALAGGFRGGDDSWYDPWNGSRTPTDRGGHGTHTLASAVGGRQVGVAPGAHWVGCVNLGRNLGNPAHYLDCLQFMLAPFPTGADPFTAGRPDRAPQVLTNSWGCPPIEGCDRDVLRPATAALAAAGIFTVVAAGNSGPYCGSVSDPPAPYPDVLTVGAVDQEGRITEFSSRGPAPGGAAKPDVVAPGADVLSAWPGGGYATENGTSMATPQVAGVVALMWSANPALVGDLDRTRRILRDTATGRPARYPPGEPADRCGGSANVTGAGLVDAYAAVRAATAAG
ncbi:S8 family serine peptidase [Micromonospora zhanjiangensis]